MAKRLRILLVCLILLILAGLLRYQMSYEDKSDHQGHGRGPPSILVNSDTKQLAAEKRYKLSVLYSLPAIYDVIKLEQSCALNNQLVMYEHTSNSEVLKSRQSGTLIKFVVIVWMYNE